MASLIDLRQHKVLQEYSSHTAFCTVLVPTYKFLLEEPGFHFQGSYLHPNPRLFKYTWRLFTLESPSEGWEFLQTCPPIGTAQAMMAIERLKGEKKSVIVYNRRLPRKQSPMIFNPNADKWSGCKWAYSFEEDPDSQWEGHK